MIKKIVCWEDKSSGFADHGSPIDDKIADLWVCKLNAMYPDMAFNISVRWTAEPPNPGWMGGSETAAINGLKNAISDDNATLISGIAHANADMSLDVYSSAWESQYHNRNRFL